MMLRYDNDVIIHENRVVVFDLDDTLYKEVEFLKSAYKEIAHSIHINDTAQNVYDFLWETWNKGGDPFGELIEHYNLGISKDEIIAIYREHVPSISLEPSVSNLLSALKNNGLILCLVTDGRSLTQRNKIDALGLDRFFCNDTIFISEEIGSDKSSSHSFEMIDAKYPNSQKYYVGDNPQKDFYWPNSLGWNTICLQDDGRNIHSQQEVSYPYSPKQVIADLGDLLKIVDWNNKNLSGMIKKKIAIYGAGGLGREVAGGIMRINNAGKDNWEFVGFYDDNIEIGTSISHYGEVLGGMEELNAVKEPLALAIAVGTPASRKIIHDRITNPKISFPNLISPSFRVLDPSTFKIGEGNIIQDNCSVTCDVEIGSYNVLNGSNVLGHDVIVGDFNVMMPGVRLSGEVKVGDGNLLGVDSVILQRVKVGDNVTLGAGSVLMTKPKDGFTYIGVPAKKFDFE